MNPDELVILVGFLIYMLPLFERNRRLRIHLLHCILCFNSPESYHYIEQKYIYYHYSMGFLAFFSAILSILSTNKRYINLWDFWIYELIGFIFPLHWFFQYGKNDIFLYYLEYVYTNIFDFPFFTGFWSLDEIFISM